MGLGNIVKRVAKGVATGGASEWGSGGALWGGSGGGSTSQDQSAFETPEQRQARQLLLQYATTGRIGDLRMGESLNMPLGDYSMSDLESAGLDRVSSDLNSGAPGQYDLGDAGLRDIMDTSEAGLDRMFSPYKALAEREQRDAEAAFTRSAGAMGNLYSTNTVKGLGDVAAKTSEINMARLADLTNNALNRKTQGIGLAYQSGRERENIAQNRLQNSFNYGGLQRSLNDAALKANYNEKLRQRQEVMGQLQGANTVSGSSVQWGVPSVSVPKENPYMEFMKLALGTVGTLKGMGGVPAFGSGANASAPIPSGYSPYTNTNRLSLY